jgi:hypothetical protein
MAGAVAEVTNGVAAMEIDTKVAVVETGLRPWQKESLEHIFSRVTSSDLGFTILLCGPPGVGKSFLAAKAISAYTVSHNFRAAVVNVGVRFHDPNGRIAFHYDTPRAVSYGDGGGPVILVCETNYTRADIEALPAAQLNPFDLKIDAIGDKAAVF